MKKFFNGLNKLLYNLFDSNVYGVLSMGTFFIGAVLLMVGQAIPGACVMGASCACLGGSIYKNVQRAKAYKKYKQEKDLNIKEYDYEQTMSAELEIPLAYTNEDVKSNNNEVSRDM